MKWIASALIAVCWSGLALGQAPPGLPDAQASAQEATGGITGIVVSAKTGEPLRSVRVMYQFRGGRRAGGRRGADQMALTGIDGKFSLTSLPAGEYAFYCSKAGYGVRNTFDVDGRVELGPGEIRDDVVIRLQPSAVITGRVFDAYGEPLPGAQVFVMSRIYQAEETRWRAMHFEGANDLGEYRIHGLGPGRYVIGAGAPHEMSPRGVSYYEYAATYYPSGDSPEQAVPVKLSWGDELDGVDFRLAPSPETAIRGVVIDETTGGPCEQCHIFVQSDSGSPQIGVSPTRDGVFLLQGVPAGSQWVVARYRGPSARQAAEQVVVPSSGIVELKLVLTRGQTVTGDVVLEDPPEPEASSTQEPERRPRRREGVFVNLQTLGPLMWGPPPRTDLPGNGGPFELQDVTPGEYRVQVRAPNGGYLRAISLDGRILEQPEIRINPEAPLSGLKLHVAFDGATVDGVVENLSENALPAQVWVVQIPEPGSNPYAEREMVRVEDGTFRLSGVVPGRYSLYALPRRDAFDLDDPEIRRSLEPFAKQVTLQEGETARVELTHIPEPQ